MFLAIFSLFIRVDDFGVVKFNSLESSDIPYLILPYYPYQKDFINITSSFLEYSEGNSSFGAAKIDCDAFTTVCSSFKLQPGKVFVSYPPHKHPKESNRKVSFQNLVDLAYDVSVDGLHEISTKEEVKMLSSKAPLFCLVARPNAGDLEVKLPIVKKVAKLYSHRNVKFGFITESFLYEQYANYPLTAFVFISPSDKHSTHRGDFTIENLVEFIGDFEQPVWGPPLPPKKIALTYVGKDTGDIIQEFAKHETYQPLVFINSSTTESIGIAKTICDYKIPCLAAVDFNSFKWSVIPRNLNTTEKKIEAFHEMEVKWNQQPLFNRLTNQFNLGFLMNFNTITTCGLVFSIFISLVALFFLDKKYEIDDPRKPKNKSKKN